MLWYLIGLIYTIWLIITLTWECHSQQNDSICITDYFLLLPSRENVTLPSVPYHSIFPYFWQFPFFYNTHPLQLHTRQDILALTCFTGAHPIIITLGPYSQKGISERLATVSHICCLKPLWVIQQIIKTGSAQTTQNNAVRIFLRAFIWGNKGSVKDWQQFPISAVWSTYGQYKQLENGGWHNFIWYLVLMEFIYLGTTYEQSLWA